MKKTISIVVPFYNEEKVVGDFSSALFNALSTLDNYAFEVIFINDGSNDNTLNILKSISCQNHNLKVISFSRNFGHEAAINAGIDRCNGDAAIVMDGDLQDSPLYIAQLIEKWEDDYDVVNVKSVDRHNERFTKRITAKLFYKLIGRWAYKINVQENVNNFRLISKRVINVVKTLTSKNKVFRFEVPFAGFKTTNIEITRSSRKGGEGHYKLADMSRLAIDSVVAVSTQPLNLITKIFLVFLGLFLISAVSELTLFLLQTYAHSLFIENIYYITWLIINVMFFFMLVLLFSIAIVAQYVARIHLETQNRPTYIIDEIYEGKKHESH